MVVKFCECGCGQEVAANRRFLPCHHLKGSTNPRYKGGIYFSNEKRRWIIICRDGSREYYARAVMEAKLKRYLLPGEVVHHLNGDTTDDSPENLFVMSCTEHDALHDYSKEDLLAALQRFYLEFGRSPKYQDLLSMHEYPHASSYRRVFGYWNNALSFAGLPIHREINRKQEVRVL